LELARLADAELLALPGGLPIIIDGAVVGAVGVSGLTAEADADLAAIALTALDQLLDCTQKTESEDTV
jgi:uncharacterized protein GlcG (DUF336 family)